MIYVLGSANADLVFRVPAVPLAGQTLLASDYCVLPGGKGLNQAVAAARLGSTVEFVGAVGSDANGHMLLGVMAANKVGTLHLTRVTGVPTGCAGIFVGDDGENAIAAAPGANSFASASAIPTGAFVLTQLEVPLVEVTQAAGAASTFILNPAPAKPIPDSLIARCTVITPNESEAASLTGIDLNDDASIELAAQDLLSRGAQHVIITLGARGVYWAHPGGSEYFDAPQVEVVDTTGAGDAFNGALAHHLHAATSMREAIPLAVQIASISTTHVGAIDPSPL